MTASDFYDEDSAKEWFDDPTEKTATSITSTSSPPVSIPSGGVSSLTTGAQEVNAVLQEVQNRWGALIQNAENLKSFASEMYQYAEQLRVDTLESMRFQLDTARKTQEYLDAQRKEMDRLKEKEKIVEERSTLHGESVQQSPQQPVEKLGIVERIKIAQAQRDKDKKEREARKQIDKALSK